MDLRCPNCQKRLSLDDKFAGQVVRCPLCNGMFQAPALPSAAPPMPPQIDVPAPVNVGVSSVPPAPVERPKSAPPRPEMPPLPEREPEPELDVSTVPQGDYTKSRRIHLRPDILVWVAPVGVTLVFALSFFTWNYSEHLSWSLWDLAFSEVSRGTYTFFVVTLVVLAWPLSIMTLVFEQRWLPLPPALRPYWAWRSAIVGGAVALPFVFLVAVYVSCFFESQGNPAAIAMKLAFRVHAVAVMACVVEFWLERRRAANKPLPRVEVRW